MSEPPEPRVLIVEDEARMADLYALWLDEFYTVTTAYNGETALELVDDDTDVVLLDRRMPDLSGGEVLSEIREQEIDCQVVMVTAVDPGFDIIEMGFDDYLMKPITREEIREAVNRQLDLREYSDLLQEYSSLLSKITALQSRFPDEQLNRNHQYTQLQSRFGKIDKEARVQLQALLESGSGADIYRRMAREWG